MNRRGVEQRDHVECPPRHTLVRDEEEDGQSARGRGGGEQDVVVELTVAGHQHGDQANEGARGGRAARMCAPCSPA